MTSAARTVDVSAIIDGRRLTGFNYGLIALSWLITVFDGFDMMLVSFTAPYMRDEFGLSKMMLGRVFSAGLVGMMLGGFIFSFVADRIGRRPTVVTAAFGFGLLTVATGFAGSYKGLLALRFLDGLALGGMLPLAWALNIEFVPARMRSTIVTIIMMGYSFGTAVAAPMTNWIAPNHGWQGVYLAGGAGTIDASVGYTGFKYKDLGTNVGCQALANPIPSPAIGANCIAGNPGYSDYPVGQPKFKGNIGAAYAIPIPGGSKLTPRLDATYQSRVFADVVNQTPEAIISPHTVLNGRIQWDAANGKWSIAALGTNLTNKQYYIALFDLRAFGEGMESGTPAPPRMYAINVKYNFQ